MVKGVFARDFQDDNELCETVEVRVSSRNLPVIQEKGNYKKQALCDICGKQHRTSAETCELVVGELDVNGSMEEASKVTLEDLISKLQYERPLIFAVGLKMTPDFKIKYYGLRPEIERVSVKDEHELSLASCFKGFTVEETLGGDDQWYCSRCAEHVDFTKKLEIYSVPEILCVQLKRFTQKKSTGPQRKGAGSLLYAQVRQNVKNSSFVNYPVDSLDMRPYVLSLKDEPEPVLYDLYGVSNHFGSLNGGHYTATCRSVGKGGWHYFNDS